MIERGSSNHLPSFALFFEPFATWLRETDPNDLSKRSIHNWQKWKWNGANAFPWFSVSMTNNAEARTSKPRLLNIYILKPPNKDTFIFPQIHSRPSADEKSSLRNSNKSLQKKNSTGVFEHIIMFYCTITLSNKNLAAYVKKETPTKAFGWMSILILSYSASYNCMESFREADFLLGVRVHNLNLQKAEQSHKLALRLTTTTLTDQSVLSWVFWCIVEVFLLKKEKEKKSKGKLQRQMCWKHGAFQLVNTRTEMV